MFPLWKTREAVSLTLEAGQIMQIRAGERLRLTLWGAGSRAVVSLNTFAVTQPALEGMDPGKDGFTYDVTSWLHDGVNILTVVLIGPPGDMPFRMTISQGEQPERTLDEANFLPLASPWRLWTQHIERLAPVFRQEVEDRQSLDLQVADDQIVLRSPGPIGLGMPLRIDHIKAPLSLVSMATPVPPESVVSTINAA